MLSTPPTPLVSLIWKARAIVRTATGWGIQRGAEAKVIGVAAEYHLHISPVPVLLEEGHRAIDVR